MEKEVFFSEIKIDVNNKPEILIIKDNQVIVLNYREMLDIFKKIEMVKRYDGELPF